MLKSKSIYFLISSIILLVAIELFNVYGYFGYINFTMESYVNDTNTNIFSLFNKLSNYSVYLTALILSLIFRGTRSYSKVALLQFLMLLSVGVLLDTYEGQYAYLYSINYDLLTVYSFGILLFMNINMLSSSKTINIFALIIVTLTVFMVTICEFYFNNTDVFGLLFNICIVCISISFTYFLLFLRKYYFL